MKTDKLLHSILHKAVKGGDSQLNFAPAASVGNAPDIGFLEDSACPLEVSVAMFKLGYELDTAGRKEAAEVVYRQTIELLESLSEKGNAKLSMNDLAEVAFNHGEKLFHLGRYNSSRVAFSRSLELIDSLILLDASFPLIERLAGTLNWLARTQRKTDRAKDAKKTYDRAIAVWKSLMRMPQSWTHLDNLRQSYGTALFGQTKVLTTLGEKEAASKTLAEFERVNRINVPNGATSWKDNQFHVAHKPETKKPNNKDSDTKDKD
jgi:tetratricopeptide (TPR) repeat protein